MIEVIKKSFSENLQWIAANTIKMKVRDMSKFECHDRNDTSL